MDHRLIIEYCIVSAPEPEQLEDKVMDLIEGENNWQPWGPMTHYSDIWFYQPMVRFN